MNVFEFSVCVAAGSWFAGLLGALTGLGGGVVIVPMLVLAFGVDIRYAIGASLISVIATSSGAAVAYLREGYTNLRIGMFLEVATTLGALGGAYLATVAPTRVIEVIFGVVLLYSAYLSGQAHDSLPAGASPHRLATKLRLNGTYPESGGERWYAVQAVPFGFALMGIAGVLSGVLGIGSGAVKVLAMDRVMRIPFKVSTTTSNFMIGVTAAASAGVYLRRGYLDPGLAMPVMLGVLAGALTGAHVLARARTRVLRIIFGIVILALGLQMLWTGLTGPT